jgi:beta-galactosidase
LAFDLDKLKHTVSRVALIDGEIPTVEIVMQASGRNCWDDFQHIQHYQLLPTGELVVENTVVISPEISDLPRVGISMTLAPGLEQLEWYGRGPWENYADRKAAAIIGKYKSSVTEEYVPYILPQENGNKTDVRWLSLTNNEGHGLKITGVPLINFSASHFTADDLFKATHTYELEPRDEVILTLDHSQRGLGTASCGPDTLERYCLCESRYEFTYLLQVV